MRIISQCLLLVHYLGEILHQFDWWFIPLCQTPANWKERVDGYPKADAKKTSQMQPNLHLKLAMSQKNYPDRNTMNVLSCAYRNTFCCFVSLELRPNALCVFEWNQRRGSRCPSATVPAGTKALLPVGPFCRAGPSWPNELRRETWGMMDGNPQWFLCQDCFQFLLILGIWILSLT